MAVYSAFVFGGCGSLGQIENKNRFAPEAKLSDKLVSRV